MDSNKLKQLRESTGLSFNAIKKALEEAGDNVDKAMEILRGKLWKRIEDERLAKERGMQLSSTTSIEWGNQIRSYVLHPYKMVKDHRTNVETTQVDKVLEGDIQEFIEAEKE